MLEVRPKIESSKLRRSLVYLVRGFQMSIPRYYAAMILLVVF